MAQQRLENLMMKKVVFATPSGYLFGNVDGYTRTCVVGRSLDCNFVLGDAAVSRRHFCLRVNDEGDLLVGDLDSRNGTFVNDELVKDERVFQIGVDQLCVCGKQVRIEAVDGADEVQGYVLKLGKKS